MCQRFSVSFSRGFDTDVSCHSLSLSFLAVYCLPLWVTVMMPPGREALRQLSGTLRLLCGYCYTTSQDSLIDPA